MQSKPSDEEGGRSKLSAVLSKNTPDALPSAAVLTEKNIKTPWHQTLQLTKRSRTQQEDGQAWLPT